jgi:RNA polymerase sigma-70 factor, ECF subfamily
MLDIFAEKAFLVEQELPSADQMLILAARRNDHEALTTIFDKYAPAIYKYTLRLCHDPILADNITGDVFGRLIEGFSKPEGGPKNNLRSYLYQTGYHLVIDKSREDKHCAPIELANGLSVTNHIDSPQERAERDQLMGQLIEAMDKELTDDQRHVIILRFLENFTLRETAEIVGKGVNNIKVIQNRGIAKLRKALHMEKNEDGTYELT